MRMRFEKRENAPERLVCEAEILFEEPGLEGLKLVGVSIWHSPEGEAYVTFPSRAFGAGAERRYFDYLRPVDSATAEAAKRLKRTIIMEAVAQGFVQPEAARPAGATRA